MQVVCQKKMILFFACLKREGVFNGLLTDRKSNSLNRQIKINRLRALALFLHLILAMRFFLLIFALASCQAEVDIHRESPPDSSPSESENVEETLTLVAIDVGQGDSTLILTPSGETILIDGGPLEGGENQILPLLTRLGIHQIDALFVSHYDGDHIGGIPEIITGNDEELGTSDDLLPDIVYDRGGQKEGDDELFKNYKEAVGEKRQMIEVGNSVLFEGGLTIDCLIINGRTIEEALAIEEEDENAHSMGLLISYGNFRYFTAGDLPGGGFSGNEQTVDLESLVAPLVGRVDVLHVNHHGSNTSSNNFFLETLNPSVALISSGEDNSYGHPHADVLNRLDQVEAEIYLTEEGSISIFVESDGTYTVNGDSYENAQQN